MPETDLSRLKIVFLGTPDFAATVLRSLLTWPKARIVGVFTQPDRPVGRGKKIRPSPVKTLASDEGLTVFQPQSLNEPEALRQLQDLDPDVLVVAAYGLLLSSRVLDLAPFGALNVHASLLPKYRGAAPIQRALANGEPVTGITIMQMVPELDAGPILVQRALAIGIDDTAGTLHDELAELGGHCLVQALEGLLRNELVPVQQDPELVSYAPKLKKVDGIIDWSRPALEVHNHIRAMHPWPGACFDWPRPDGRGRVRVQVYPGRIGPEHGSSAPVPGTVLEPLGEELPIACQDRTYLVQTLKPSSGRPMSAREFACGYMRQGS
jgi:methionyl-tRNA formyltransferase